MDATALFIIGVVIASLLAAAAVFSVAFRRGPTSRPVATSSTGVLNKRTVKRDLKARAEQENAEKDAASVAELAEEELAISNEEKEPIPDPLLDREQVSAEEFDSARRKFFNRAILGLFGGAFLGGLTISFLAFLWPKLSGGFGSAIVVGKIEDLRREIAQGDGSFVPKFAAAAQSWIVPYTPTSSDTTSQFDELPVTAGGTNGELALMALWQRCVHLGCRVPSCVSSQGFECPCHGSKYNLHGEYEDGPAPRNLDRFAVELNDRGELVVLTGNWEIKKALQLSLSAGY